MNMNVKFLIKPRKHPIIRWIKSSPLYTWRSQSLLWSIGLSCLMASCINDTDFVDESNPEGKNVQFTLNTRALNTGTDEQINTIRIIQVARNVSQSIRSNTFVNNPEDPLVVQGISGDFDIYVIANEGDNPGSQLNGLQGLASLEALKKVVLPYTIANRTESNIPMLGVVEKVTITSDPASTPSESTPAHIMVNGVDKGTTLPISLTRLAIKINLHLRGKNFSVPKQVMFTNLPDAVPLFPDVSYEPATGEDAISKTVNLTEGTVGTGYIWDKVSEAIILPCYQLVDRTASGKAASLQVTLDNNKTVSAFIGHSVKSDSKDYGLHRNTVYSLTGNVNADKLSVIATVANWDIYNQDYPAGGGSFWENQPKSYRVGIDGGDKTAVFTAAISSNAEISYKWYRRCQNTDLSYTIEELQDKMNGVTIQTKSDNKTSELKIVVNKLDDSGEIYCRGITTSPDGSTETLESDHATLMVVGTQESNAGDYPEMENWTPPRNALLGATCLLRDGREKGKVYRVKLMADGNWWMIMDLAFGNVSTEDDYLDYADSKDTPTRPDNVGLPDELNILGGGYKYGMAVNLNYPTGGFQYNCHAALQLPGLASDKDDGSLDYEFLPSICPEGWHLPGNMNREFNYEWRNLVSKIMNTDITKFEYNSSHDFNAYTQDATDGYYYFHGGYLASPKALRKPMTYWTLPIKQEGGIITISEDAGDRLSNDFETPIRCVRNFK